MIKYDSYDKSVKVPIGLNFIDVLYLEGLRENGIQIFISCFLPTIAYLALIVTMNLKFEMFVFLPIAVISVLLYLVIHTRGLQAESKILKGYEYIQQQHFKTDKVRIFPLNDGDKYKDYVSQYGFATKNNFEIWFYGQTLNDLLKAKKFKPRFEYEEERWVEEYRKTFFGYLDEDYDVDIIFDTDSVNAYLKTIMSKMTKLEIFSMLFNNAKIIIRKEVPSVFTNSEAELAAMEVEKLIINKLYANMTVDIFICGGLQTFEFIRYFVLKK